MGGGNEGLQPLSLNNAYNNRLYSNRAVIHPNGTVFVMLFCNLCLTVCAMKVLNKFTIVRVPKQRIET